MRLDDLISKVNEQVEQTELANDVEEIITRAKARGFTRISTGSILKKLEYSGYVIDMDNLKKILNNIQSVGSVTDEITVLDTAVPDVVDKKKADSTVSKMASKQLKKGIK